MNTPEFTLDNETMLMLENSPFLSLFATINNPTEKEIELFPELSQAYVDVIRRKLNLSLHEEIYPKSQSLLYKNRYTILYDSKSRYCINRPEFTLATILSLNNRPELLNPDNEFFMSVQAGKNMEKLLKVKIDKYSIHISEGDEVLSYLFENDILPKIYRDKNHDYRYDFIFLEKTNPAVYDDLLVYINNLIDIVNIILDENLDPITMLRDKDYLIKSFEEIYSYIKSGESCSIQEFHEEIDKASDIYQTLRLLRKLFTNINMNKDFSEDVEFNELFTEVLDGKISIEDFIKKNIPNIREKLLNALFNNSNDFYWYDRKFREKHPYLIPYDLLVALYLAKQMELVINNHDYQNLIYGIDKPEHKLGFNYMKDSEVEPMNIYGDLYPYGYFENFVMKRVMDKMEREKILVARVKLPKSIFEHPSFQR